MTVEWIPMIYLQILFDILKAKCFLSMEEYSFQSKIGGECRKLSQQFSSGDACDAIGDVITLSQAPPIELMPTTPRNISSLLGI